jgi:NAD(P)-dependent dehydrogenase (short-subunit alcohol dehydrogenase family)
VKELDGKVALITGGGSGIGRGTGIALAKRGVKVILADINEAGAQEGAETIRTAGGEATAVKADVGAADAFDMLHAFAAETYGAVDILMNNVGVLVMGVVGDIPLAEWERVLNLNLMSVIRAQHRFVPEMVARGSGHIVNTASFAGLFPYAYDRLPYAAGKGAIVTMSEGLALYCKPRGVGVTLLCPGPVKTNIGASLKSWTEGLPLRGPGAQFAMLDPLDVGEQVAEAIVADRFFLPTDELVKPVLQEREADRDAFLARQIAGFDA